MFLVFFCCTVATVGAFSDSTDAIRTAVCSKGFSVSCLKLDLLGMVARTGRSVTYKLFSGVSLSHNLTSITPPGLLQAVHEGNATSQELDAYVSSAVNDYLSSVTLSVRVLDQSSVSTARSISDRILTSLLPQETGRKKGHGHGGAALWAAGMLATAGMAALAAISGKAMMTSMLAMVMAGVSTLRNNNGNSNSCPNTHVIEAHARAIEEERLAAMKPIEVYTVNEPHMSAPVHNLKQMIPTYMVN